MGVGPFCDGVALTCAKPLPDMPLELVTIGDHVKKRRLELGLTQLQVAERLEVEEQTVWYWENRKSPWIQLYPVIFDFLGYNPLPDAATTGGQIRRLRLAKGYSKLRLAKLAGTDEPTIKRIEEDDPTVLNAVLRSVLDCVSEG